MTFKKQSPTPWTTTTEQEKYSKTRETTPSKFFIINFHFKYFIFFLISVISWFFILFFLLPPTNLKHQPHRSSLSSTKRIKSNLVVDQRRQVRNPSKNVSSVYIYNLPPEYNLGLIEDCAHLNIYTNMCPHVANRGLGQQLPLSDDGETGSGSGAGGGPWFATHQFIAEMIFHARMENHPHRTWDPARASLFYVPFYGGLHASSKFREMNLTARDDLAVRLMDFLLRQPTWRKNNGKDHFMVLGRTAWDFMRSTESGPDFGANSLLNLPRVQSMSVFTVETNPWKKKTNSNQYGLPYPSYFHPSTSAQMLTWQTKVRKSNRSHLFSFIGAPRKGLEKAAIRDELIRQCDESTRCELLQCNNKDRNNKCYEPSEIMRVMTGSDFCLQAPGDSFTRRSTFDAVLAGCVPVFFSPHTAYTQYGWFLPDNPEEYSVYIDEEEAMRAKRVINVEDELLKIPRERVEKMRKTVINLIPRLTYKHPNASDDGGGGFRDIVDVALDALGRHSPLVYFSLSLNETLRDRGSVTTSQDGEVYS
ncbi:hypothetical protein LWI28_021831 [Acer negundo]|uniref:Exostosin GT47 domain-containing protein n=1 Tax=Acer negundo TaxID=4023 RepID=A0AAD5IFL0_ACENE|nr:hypothetical protein LWI28_021831 [Acer negundo]KAK4838368.1 hypothetical protein QYF36_013219 [Acer negundo]